MAAVRRKRNRKKGVGRLGMGVAMTIQTHNHGAISALAFGLQINRPEGFIPRLQRQSSPWY